MSLAALQAQLDTLQRELTSLRHTLLTTQQTLTQTQQALESSQRENTLLRQKLDALARRCFGQKSERLDPAQFELLLQGLVERAESPAALSVAPPAPPRRSQKLSRRLRTPDNLEVRREVIEPTLIPDEPQLWQRLGQEVSRLLDYQPGQFFWRETVRPKYVRRDQRALPPVVAPAPARVADHILAAPGLLAQLLVGKYCDHLPFYRQEQIFRQRHGVWIARQQMVQWTEQSVRLLSGITDVLKSDLRRGPYVQVDETPVRYQDPTLKGRCGQGYLWTALVPGQCVVYEWHPSRAARCLDSLLGAHFTGRLQCDGYSAYPAYAQGVMAVELCGCWAHVRRGFFEARAQAPQVAGWVLHQIGWLYHWEGDLRESRAGPVWRQAYRASHHRLVLERLHRALIRLQPRYLPQSGMGQAITYALNQWPTLVRFLEHGEVEIDNNRVENAIRPIALGRKNWLFFGSEEAGQRSAVMYTLIENCRLHGVDPYTYLKDVLERLPTTTNQQVAQLTPQNWQAARAASSQPAA